MEQRNTQSESKEKLSQNTSKGEKELKAVSSDSRLQIYAANNENQKESVASHNPEQGPRAYKYTRAADESFDPVNELTPKPDAPRVAKARGLTLMNIIATLLTVLWGAACWAYWDNFIAAEGLNQMMPHEFGGMLATALAPVALLWMTVSSFQRQKDVEYYASTLKSELHSILFPTEERAARIHKDVEALVEQSADLATSSKAVLKSIHRARYGLRTEMKEFVVLAKKGENHINALSKGLADKMMKANHFTKQLQDRMTAMDEVSKETLAQWDQSIATIAEKASNIEGQMQKGSATLLSTVDQASEKADAMNNKFGGTIKALNDNVENVSEVIETLSGQFEGQVVKLTDAADTISMQASTFAEELENQLDGIDGITARANEALAAGRETMTHHKDLLDQGATNMMEKATSVQTMLSDKIADMYMSGSSLLEQFDGFEDRVGAQANRLSDSVQGLGQYLEQIENTGQEAYTRLSEAMSGAISVSENMASNVRRSAETMRTATKEAEDRTTRLTHVVDTEMKRLEDGETRYLGRISDYTEAVNESFAKFDGMHAVGEGLLSNLNERTEAAQENFNGTITTLKDTLDTVDNNISEPLMRISTSLQEIEKAQENLGVTLEKRVTELTNTSNNAFEKAKTIRDMLKGQAQDIASISGQISGHAQTIGDHLKTQKEEFSSVFEMNVDLSGKAKEMLTDNIEQLKEAAQLSQNVLTETGNTVRVEFKALRDEHDKTNAGFDGMIGRFKSHTDELSRIRDMAVEDIESLNTAIEAATKSAEPFYQTMIEKSEKAQDVVRSLSADVDRSVDGTLTRLQDVSSLFKTRTSELHSEAENAVNALSSVNDKLNDGRETVLTTTQEITDRSETLLKSMQQNIADVHLAVDQSEVKLENFEERMQEHTASLSQHVSESITRLESAESGFTRASNSLSAHLSMTEKGYEGLRTTIQTEVKHIEELADSLTDKTYQVANKAASQSKTLAQATEATLSNIKQIGDSVSIRALELTEQIKASLETAKGFGQELRASAAEVGNSTHRAVDQISVSVSDLLNKAEIISTTTNAMVSDIAKSGDSLKDRAKDIKSVSDTVQTMTEETGRAFRENATMLREASDTAMTTVDTIRNAELRYERDMFYSSAKFVMESLYSLSVDILRGINGGEADAMDMKAYERGDIAVFGRQLASLGETFPHDKVHKKFTNDTEFRTYVQRFIRQFEEMFDQAKNNDYGSILSATILASDLGKIYASLCKATGRSARTAVKH